MPEKGWTALTVREHVGIRIKELAKKQDLTVSDYLEQIIAVLSSSSEYPYFRTYLQYKCDFYADIG